MVLEHFHGAVCRIDPTATAYPHRDPGYNLVLTGQWMDPAETDANVAWVRDTFAALEPYTAPKSYVNYLADDEDERVDATPTGRTSIGCGRSSVGTTRTTCSASTRTSTRRPETPPIALTAVIS